MPRIPETELARIKTTIALKELVETSGITLKRHGGDWVGHCPFHDDKTPSLVITPEKNLWHCLGACQTGGSVIDWTMKKEGVSFRDAVEFLRSKLPSLAADEQPPTEKSTQNKPSHNPKYKLAHESKSLKFPLIVDDTRDNQAALKQVIDYYHATLKQSPEALEYLAQRGLNHPEMIERFKLGYSNRTLGLRLPNKQVQAGAKLRAYLQSIGLLRESGHEHFSGSLVIPVMDEHGTITEVYGRKILGKRLRKGTPIHTYLPGPHRGVFNPGTFKNYDEIILCESLIDALTFYCNGFYNVTTSYGVSGFTDDLLNAFKNSSIKKITIAYDRDEAGYVAGEKLSKILSALGIECYRILFPQHMDVNEYATQVKPADKSLGVLLRKAEWMCKGQGNQASSLSNPLENVNPNHNAPIGTPSDAAVTESLTNKAAKEKKESANAAASIPVEPSVAAAPIVNPNPNLGSHTNINANVSDHEVTITLGTRFYRIRGLHKNMSYEQLKINLLIKHNEQFHVDTLDIYSARHRGAYIKQAAAELGLKEEIIKQDVGKLFLKLEELQDKHIQGVHTVEDKTPKISDKALKEAFTFLQSPNLLEKINADFNQLGIVGETTNKLVGYLAATSRKLDKPLAVMVQSSSAAGKSLLMEAILSLMPTEERIHYSAMTGQALFYMGEQDLKHKILSIAEEEGASQTAYALKLLQSEGEVSIASTGKNPTTGNLETQEYRVEGPVMLFSTTTAIDIDEELMNRCLILSVDESREQTQAIHRIQRNRRTLAGLRAKEAKKSLIELHQNAQRLLRPLAVLNPYAAKLTFLDNKTRTRRDHEKYLTLIDTIALLHQYQRPIKKEKHNDSVTEYIEITLDDIEIANRLAHEVLGKTLDELPPQTRRLLHLTHEMVAEQMSQHHIKQIDYRFSRKKVRDYSGFSDFQVKKHLKRLEELEYILMHKGRRGQSYEYELLYQGEGEGEGDGSDNDANRFVMGLIDVKKLRYDEKKEPLKNNKEPLNKKKEPSSSPQSAPKSPPGSTDKTDKNIEKNSVKATLSQEGTKNALLVEKKEPLASYPSASNPSLSPPPSPLAAVLPAEY